MAEFDDDKADGVNLNLSGLNELHGAFGEAHTQGSESSFQEPSVNARRRGRRKKNSQQVAETREVRKLQEWRNKVANGDVINQEGEQVAASEINTSAAPRRVKQHAPQLPAVFNAIGSAIQPGGQKSPTSDLMSIVNGPLATTAGANNGHLGSNRLRNNDSMSNAHDGSEGLIKRKEVKEAIMPVVNWGMITNTWGGYFKNISDTISSIEDLLENLGTGGGKGQGGGEYIPKAGAAGDKPEGLFARLAEMLGPLALALGILAGIKLEKLAGSFAALIDSIGNGKLFEGLKSSISDVVQFLKGLTKDGKPLPKPDVLPKGGKDAPPPGEAGAAAEDTSFWGRIKKTITHSAVGESAPDANKGILGYLGRLQKAPIPTLGGSLLGMVSKGLGITVAGMAVSHGLAADKAGQQGKPWTEAGEFLKAGGYALQTRPASLAAMRIGSQVGGAWGPRIGAAGGTLIPGRDFGPAEIGGAVLGKILGPKIGGALGVATTQLLGTGMVNAGGLLADFDDPKKRAQDMKVMMAQTPLASLERAFNPTVGLGKIGPFDFGKVGYGQDTLLSNTAAHTAANTAANQKTVNAAGAMIHTILNFNFNNATVTTQSELKKYVDQVRNNIKSSIKQSAQNLESSSNLPNYQKNMLPSYFRGL